MASCGRMEGKLNVGTNRREGGGIVLGGLITGWRTILRTVRHKKYGGVSGAVQYQIGERTDTVQDGVNHTYASAMQHETCGSLARVGVSQCLASDGLAPCPSARIVFFFFKHKTAYEITV